MMRPLRNRTMGAVREGRGNPSPYSIKGIQENLVPQIYYVTDKNRIFNYEAQRASAVIRFHCIPNN